MNQNLNQILEQLNHFSPKLIERINNLTESEWTTQSRCEDWTVKEVIYHLTSALTMYFHVIDTAQKAGDIRDNPNINYMEPGIVDGKSNAGPLSKRTKEASKNFKPNSKLASEFESASGRLTRAFNSCEDRHWNLTAYHPVNWVSVGRMLLWTLFESAIHSWDVLNAIDNEYIVDENLAPLLPQYFCDPLLNRWFINPDLPDITSKNITVNFGESEGLLISSKKRGLTIEKCQLQLTDSDAVINSTYSEFALLITGRKNLNISIDESLTELDGVQSDIDTFTRWFTGS